MTVPVGRRSRAPWIAAGLVAFVLFAGGVAVASYVGLHQHEPVASGRPAVAATTSPITLQRDPSPNWQLPDDLLVKQYNRL